MVDYYKILKVSQNASRADIRSAYRRLARKKHPDVNDGDKKSTRAFTQIAKAYKILSDPQDRAFYDQQRLKATFSEKDSIFNSDNPHAQRLRQMAYEKRYNAIIDRMIADERRETMALQKIIFPIVALFISTGFVAVFKPLFWSNSNIFGKIIMLTLFIVGFLHLLKRIHAGLERYTYTHDEIHDSIFTEIEEEPRPYSRITAISFLIVGIFTSLGVGLLIGSFFGIMTNAMMPRIFAQTLHPEFIFYPPIVVLMVDLMHSFATKLEY